MVKIVETAINKLFLKESLVNLMWVVIHFAVETVSQALNVFKKACSPPPPDISHHFQLVYSLSLPSAMKVLFVPTLMRVEFDGKINQ